MHYYLEGTKNRNHPNKPRCGFVTTPEGAVQLFCVMFCPVPWRDGRNWFSMASKFHLWVQRTQRSVDWIKINSI